MNEEIKKQIEEYAEISAREGVENITSNKQHITPKTLHIALKMSIKLGASFILSKWQDSERWRKVKDGEYPEIDQDVWLKQIHEDGSVEYDVGYLHTGDNKIFICGLLTRVDEWKPIH